MNRSPSAVLRHAVLSNKAFTLLELIVVMVLIALTVSLAVPKISDFLYTDQLKVVARKLVGLINRSSQLAQRHQAPYLLKYREDERRFVVEPEQMQDANTTESEERGVTLPEPVTVKDYWTWYSGTRPSGSLVVRFNKNGYIEPTALHFQGESGQEISILLTPFLGKIQIIDSYVTPDKETSFQ